MNRFVLQPSQLTFMVALCLFVLLLCERGWIWPLKAVAAMLPVTAFLIFT